MSHRAAAPLALLAALGAAPALVQTALSASAGREAHPSARAPAGAPAAPPPVALRTASAAYGGGATASAASTGDRRMVATSGVRSAAAGTGPPTPVARRRVRSAGARGLSRVAAVRGDVALRSRPRGPAVATVGPRTELGSPRVLGVAARRGRWLGVVTTARGNGELGWVERGHPALRLRRVRWSLHVDLSGRRLELRRGGRRVASVSVGVGAPASPTPTGRFAVTDRLRGARFGPYYGCCILALSGRQPNLPPDWRGGDRLAIHGTDAPGTIGKAVSAGCLRAADRDLEALMRRVPLGTPVLVRR